MDSPISYLTQIPPFTKIYLLSVLALGIAITWDALPAESIMYEPHRVWQQFEVWRLVLPFLFYGKMGI